MEIPEEIWIQDLIDEDRWSPERPGGLGGGEPDAPFGRRPEAWEGKEPPTEDEP
jgi:hypothetical protein